MRRRSGSLVLVLLLAAACGSNTPSSGAGSTPRSSASVIGPSTAGTPATTSAPSGSKAPSSSTSAGSGEPTPEPTAAADPSGGAPTDSAPAPSPTASLAASPCQPEGDNPSFWPGIASSVSWEVYCAVLPKGWVLSGGSYRLANGGKLLVSYKGPNGAGVTLSEGSFCSDGSGCVPSGSDAGAANFGPIAGSLVATDAGGYAIVAARGGTPSWLMVTSGLDQATTIALGAALARVTG